MRRKLLFLLLVPPLALLPLAIYRKFVPAPLSGVVLEGVGGAVVVRDVVPNSPFADAGLRADDRFVSLDGQPLSNPDQYVALLFRSEPDAAHRLEYEREGRRSEVAFRMRRVAPLRGQFLVQTARLPILLACLATGLLLWYRGKGLAVAEQAGAMFILIGVVALGSPATWGSLNSAARLLQRYPLHLGEAAFVLSPISGAAAAVLLLAFANNMPRTLVHGGVWKALALAVSAAWAALLCAYNASLIEGRMPDWVSQGAWLVNRYVPIPYGLSALLLLFVNYRATKDLNDRRRVRILLAGLAPMALAGSVWLPLARRLPLSNPLTWLIHLVILLCVACLPASFAYALLKHRLFDVRVFVRRGLQYALARGSLAALAVIPALAVLVDLYRNRWKTLGEVLSTNALAYIFAAAIVGVVLIRRRTILRSLDRRFFREAYDPREVHLEVARLLAQPDDLERDSQRICKALVGALHASYGAVLLRARTSGPFRPSALLPGETGETPFAEAEIPVIPPGSRIADLLGITGKPFEVDLANARSFLRQLPENDQELLRSWKAGMLAPVGPGTVEAILALGEKLSEQPYSEEDLKLVQAVTLEFSSAYFSREGARREARERMRECPRCGACYPEDAERCARDGSALLDSALSLALAGRYRLERRLGAGGMGVVYLGQDSELGRPVAVKVIHPEIVAQPVALERFRREARAAASLIHPNVVSVFDFGTLAGGGAFLVMEYLEGETVRQLLREEAPLPAERTLQILDGVVAALEAAHSAGIVHRDLKPDNVMVSRQASGRTNVKVLDFGLAKNLAAEEATLTADGRLAGTLAYMAPEQMEGQNVDARTDIYALAVVVHEMLAGRRPERGKPSEGPWRPALERALSHRADARHATVREFYQDLRKSLLG